MQLGKISGYILFSYERRSIINNITQNFSRFIKQQGVIKVRTNVGTNVGTLGRFISNLCGEFNNDRQIEEEMKAGQVSSPKAKHINQVCNDKIENLPDGFKGYFVIEESYYEVGGRKNILPHLFLFDLNEEGKVVLTSYELPEGVKKEEFRNDNEALKMDYNHLKKSEKFNPMVYEAKEEAFEGASISDFGNGLIFTLKEKTTPRTLEVSEIFERNGKKTFGFDSPIIYDRQDSYKESRTRI